MLHYQMHYLQKKLKGAGAEHKSLYKLLLFYFFTQVSNPTSQPTHIQIPNMLARTYITYVAIAAVALVSMTSAAPAGPADILTTPAVAIEIEGPDFLPVPKAMFPMCCLHKIAACCISDQYLVKNKTFVVHFNTAIPTFCVWLTKLRERDVCWPLVKPATVLLMYAQICSIGCSSQW